MSSLNDPLESKRIEICRMLIFLEFKKDEHIVLQEIILQDKSYPSCDGGGKFYLNFFASRKPLPFPSAQIINHTHKILIIECKKKLCALQLRHKIRFMDKLLKKYHRIEFI